MALLVIVRLSGKRTVGQFTPFDLLVMLLLSEAVSNALIGGDDSLSGGLLVALVLIMLNYLVSVLSSRSRRFRRLVEGSPKLIGTDGRLDREALRRENVAVADVEKRLRKEDTPLEEVAQVFLESAAISASFEGGQSESLFKRHRRVRRGPCAPLASEGGH